MSDESKLHLLLASGGEATLAEGLATGTCDRAQRPEPLPDPDEHVAEEPSRAAGGSRG